MSGTFRFIDANSLRFIHEEDSNLLQTDKNRLYEDYDYPYKYFSKITMLLQQDSDLWFQFRTNYSNIVVELYDCDGNTTTLDKTFIPVDDADDWDYYQTNIDTSNLNGFYYVRISLEEDEGKAIAHFRSDWFNVSPTQKETLLIEWYGGNANEIPMQWDDKTQELRLRSNIADYEAGNNLTTQVGSDNNIVTIISDPLNIRYLNIDNITEYLTEKLNIAISHDKFYVNGQEFKTDEPISIEDRKGDTLTYSFRIKLQETDYLNYASDPILEGELPIIPERSLAFDSTTSLAFDSTTSLKFT